MVFRMSTEFLVIRSSWNDKSKYNVFSIRGIGERYDNLYRYLNAPTCSARTVFNDFPWDHIIFDDLWDEQQFINIYEFDIENDQEYPYQKQPKALNKIGIVPIKDRVIGESYLNTCGHYHVHEDPNKNLEDELLAIMSNKITEEIDAEILGMLLQK